MTYATDADLEVLKDTGPHDDSGLAHHRRVAAVWAYAHDLAAERYGDSEIGQFFSLQAGIPLVTELESMPPTATAADMLAVARRHLKLEDADPSKSRKAKPATAEPVPAPAPAPPRSPAPESHE